MQPTYDEESLAENRSASTGSLHQQKPGVLTLTLRLIDRGISKMRLAACVVGAWSGWSMYDDDMLCVHGRGHVSTVSAVSCSRMMPHPAWSLAHLVLLEVFSIQGDLADDVMCELLQSSAVPVLPASLKLLHQYSREGIECDSVLR